MSRIRRAFAVVLAVSLISVGSSAWAQQDGQRGRGGFVPFGGGGGSIGLLLRDDVRKELEIVDDQVEKIRALGDSMREQMRGLFSGLRDLPEDERRAKFAELREKMEEQQKELSAKVDEILLPHQRDRLKQIGLQMQMRYRGTSGLLTDQLAEQLNITDEQKEKLRAKAEEVRKSLDERIAKARAEARDELLEVLTPDQREKLKALLGDDFQADSSNPGGGFRRRGGDGGGRGRGGENRPAT
jgi:Spy/CpxP family protein refolding chaperone